MRLFEVAFYVVVATAALFLINPIIKERWSNATKFTVRFVSPVFVFAGMAFYYVNTGENLPDTIAKKLFCWGDKFEACAKPPGKAAISEARAPPPPQTGLPATPASVAAPVPTSSPADHFSKSGLSAIAVTRENCIEAGKQADRYFHANNRARMHELLEVTLSLCSRIRDKDRPVKLALAGAYVALGSNLTPGSADACKYYGEARLLFSELSEPHQTTQIDFMRKIDNCP